MQVIDLAMWASEPVPFDPMEKLFIKNMLELLLMIYVLILE
jgi:hypothetical protein